MSAAHLALNRDFSQLSNSLLSELKTSYPIWEDLIAKSGKFHSSLKLTIQHSAVFLDAVQKVADLATRTYGGSREIGAGLTRLCLRQKRLENKLKTMSNHLVTSLANPLTSKLEEWRRTLTQLEKDRSRQTKRARAELKRALSEASRWQKKAAKRGTAGTDLGPGVGHGIPPNSATVGSKASVVAAQVANAAREVETKTGQVEAAEKSAVRSLMLEERGRFCFFLSCLLPVLECQSSMLSEIAAIDELIQSLSKAANNPDRLMEDAESILFRVVQGDHSSMSRSSFYMSEHENPSGLIAAATAALFSNNGQNDSRSNTNHELTQIGSSDTDSGRLTMEAAVPETRREGPSDDCSLASSTQLNMEMGFSPGINNVHFHNNHISGRCHSMCDPASLSIGGVSSHSSSGGSNAGYGYFNSTGISAASPGAFSSGRLRPSTCVVDHPALGLKTSRKSSLTSVHSTTSLCAESGNLLSAVSARVVPNRNLQQGDPDESQFQTLCRSGHNRTASVGGGGVCGNSLLAGSDADMQGVFGPSKPRPDSVSEAHLSLNQYSLSTAGQRPVVDPEWLRACDQANDEDEDDDEEDDEDDDDDDDDDNGDTNEGSDAAEPGDVTARQSSTLLNADEEEGGEYVEFNGEANSNSGPVLPPAVGGVGQGKTVVDAVLSLESGGINSGRHTISSAYERGGSAGNRVLIGALSFSPPIGKSSSKDSGVDSSTVLYPNQALPPPVYTNLSQLAHAAQRKFSISNLSHSVQNSMAGDSISKAFDPNGILASPSRALQSGDFEPSCNHSPNTRLRNRDSGSVGSPGLPHQQTTPQQSSTRHSVSDLAGAVRSAPQTPMSSSALGNNVGGGCAAQNNGIRRGTLPTAGFPVTRSGSSGVDPFSVELDELDRMVTADPYASMPRLRVARAVPRTLRGSPDFASVTPPTSPLASTSATAIPAFDGSTTPIPSGFSPVSLYMQSLSPLPLVRTLGRPGNRISHGSPLPSAKTTSLPHSTSQTTLVNLFHATSTGEHGYTTPPRCPPRSITLPPGAWERHHPEEDKIALRHSIDQTLTEAHSEPLVSLRPVDTSGPPPISPKPLKLKQAIITRNRMSLGSSEQSPRVPPPPPARCSSFLGPTEPYNAHLGHGNTLPRPGRSGLLNGLPSRISSSSCASSLTIASSTSESQPSINGANRTTRRLTPGLQAQDSLDASESRSAGSSVQNAGPWAQTNPTCLTVEQQHLHRPATDFQPSVYGKQLTMVGAAPQCNRSTDDEINSPGK
ncbi:Metastasis suppressor protein 1 [Fasciola hepatica]|uniref:Metastasis suppressor protein 1 n=1 Tax=Fasciola hepatica TaxID=6192 RepID=A0A4E0R591_FASHE|nr:Metastasis suppressor protein 1 [Fasciola hepatica]